MLAIVFVKEVCNSDMATIPGTLQLGRTGLIQNRANCRQSLSTLHWPVQVPTLGLAVCAVVASRGIQQRPSGRSRNHGSAERKRRPLHCSTITSHTSRYPQAAAWWMEMMFLRIMQVHKGVPPLKCGVR